MTLVSPATPPMGWNGFNHFGPGMTAAQVTSGAKALVSTGMTAAGYEYVNIDGGWNSLTRTADGNLQAKASLYPHGIRPVVGYIHSLGLKAGIYLSAGRTNCAKTSTGSWNHYIKDAQWAAVRGFDFVKFDYCNMPKSQTPLTAVDVQRDATRMAADLAATGRPILLDVNPAAYPHGNDWTWARSIGAGMWRVTGDITGTFTNMVSHVDQMFLLAAYAGPGGWNDPDMLEVGNGNGTRVHASGTVRIAQLSEAEERAQFSLWVILAAPLIAGNDLTRMDAYTLQTLTQPAVLDVARDPLGKPGHLIAKNSGRYVIARPLAGGDVAVVLFNASDSKAVISVTTAALGLAAGSCQMANLWSGAIAATTGPVTATVGAHTVRMYRITPQG